MLLRSGPFYLEYAVWHGLDDNERQIARLQAELAEEGQIRQVIETAINLLADADRNWKQAGNERRQAFARSLFSEVVFDLDTRRIAGFKLKSWIEPYLQVRVGTVMLPEGSSVQAVRWLAPQDAELLVLRCTSRNRTTRKRMPHNHLAETDRNAEIMRRYQAGESSAALVREFGVSDRRIRRIIQRYS